MKSASIEIDEVFKTEDCLATLTRIDTADWLKSRFQRTDAARLFSLSPRTD
jgi:hypothetical protein